MANTLGDPITLKMIEAMESNQGKPMTANKVDELRTQEAIAAILPVIEEALQAVKKALLNSPKNKASLSLTVQWSGTWQTPLLKVKGNVPDGTRFAPEPVLCRDPNQMTLEFPAQQA